MLKELDRTDRLLQSYDSRLFCKWDDDALEIWEHGTKGKDYLVAIIGDRPLDYKDIEDLHARNIATSEQSITDEIDEFNRTLKYQNEREYHKHIRRVSFGHFNQIFHNPVITGQITINP